MPQVIAARDHAEAAATIDRSIAGLGTVPECSPCATLAEDSLHLRPPLAWLGDRDRLGAALSARLSMIHRNRPAAARQFYASPQQGAGNPSFDHELAYPAFSPPDAGLQILALFRFWNIVE